MNEHSREPRRRPRTARPVRLGAILAAAFLLAPSAGAAPAAGEAAQPAGATCELHVWGAGRPNFRPRSNAFVKIDQSQLDRSNPLSAASLYDPVNRAEALSDEELRKLLPTGGEVVVVRHETIIDIDRTPLKSLSGRLQPGRAACYADLILGNLYAILPNPGAAWERFGLIGGLLTGSDRLVIEFWLRDFSGPGPVPRVYRKKNDSPLPHVPPNSAEMKAALEASANVNLHSFADHVDHRRRR